MGHENEGRFTAVLHSLSDAYTILMQTLLGYQNTFRGYVYSKNDQVPPSFVAFGNDGILLQREKEANEDESNALGNVVDRNSLELKGRVWQSPEHIEPGSRTVQLSGDGSCFYWTRIFHVVDPDAREQAGTAFIVFVDTFTIDCLNNVSLVGERKFLERLDDTEESRRAVFAGILNSSTTHNSKVANNQQSNSRTSSSGIGANSTSMRIGHRFVSTCPIWVCGGHLTMLAPVSAPSATTASVSFAGTSSSSGKLLASNWSFSLDDDGEFEGRADL